MSDTALAGERLPDAAGAAPTPQGRSLFSSQGRRALRAVGLVIVLLSVLVSSGSFMVMTGATGVEPSP
jgi:two-component system nitrogen regulation sensor histidine kinase NtrY